MQLFVAANMLTMMVYMEFSFEFEHICISLVALDIYLLILHDVSLHMYRCICTYHFVRLFCFLFSYIVNGKLPHS